MARTVASEGAAKRPSKLINRANASSANVSRTAGLRSQTAPPLRDDVAMGVRTQLSQDSFQPLVRDRPPLGRKSMAAVEQVKLDVAHANPEAFRISLCDFRRIDFIAPARDVEHGCPHRLILPRLPIGGQPAANADHAAHRIRIRGYETVIEAHRLGE